ncbi:MAG: HIT family protein [Bacteroidales bacterium]|jgi:histidine triad (HIT) family protein|nr:HIT family protein [Bacteroidales bacterium]
MTTIFSKIIKGEIPAYKIAENDRFLAFLDINPLAKGHTLVIPKKEVDYIFDMDDQLYADCFLFAKKVALAIKKVVQCEKVGVAVVGLEVFHAHIHLVPINDIYDIDFKKPKLKFTQEEFLQIAKLISDNL